jgi:hypothetical protein
MFEVRSMKLEDLERDYSGMLDVGCCFAVISNVFRAVFFLLRRRVREV